jgi:hypothetical protein
MQNSFYRCGECDKSFSRKWNADRHNELVHGNLSFIKNRNFKPKPGLQKNSIHHAYKNKFKRFQSTKHKIKDGVSDELFSGCYDVEPESLKTIRIFGQLLSPFEELEKILEDRDEQVKADILHKIFVSCLDSHRPVKSMNEVVLLYRSIKGINKIAQSTSKSLKMPVGQAEFVLKELVKGSVHFKHHIK